MNIQPDYVAHFFSVIAGAAVASYLGAFQGRRRQGQAEEKEFRERLIRVERHLSVYRNETQLKETEIRGHLHDLREGQQRLDEAMKENGLEMAGLAAEVRTLADRVQDTANRMTARLPGGSPGTV